MDSNIEYCKPTEEDMNTLVEQWWAKLDDEIKDKNSIPTDGKISDDKNYVFLYGHYDKVGHPSGLHEGHVNGEHKDRMILAPLINGRYGVEKNSSDSAYAEFDEDEKTGVLLSQYATDLYASIIRGNNIIDIPQVHWIAHELPKAHDISNSGFYYGIWICINGQGIEPGDTLKFGGKGGPNVAKLYDNGKLNINKDEWLQRFETHAIWHM